MPDTTDRPAELLREQRREVLIREPEVRRDLERCVFNLTVRGALEPSEAALMLGLTDIAFGFGIRAYLRDEETD